MFYGPGAGGAPTASAVLGDVVSVARNRLRKVTVPGSRRTRSSRCSNRRAHTRYHVSIDVDDRAGVLASVAGAFAEFGVSIRTVRQEGSGEDAQLVIVTHEADDAALRRRSPRSAASTWFVTCHP